jgi:DNA ligase (NAD+)
MIQSQQEYLSLITKVNQFRNEVHLFSEENISEEALDNLKMQITDWERDHPESIDPNSPNYTIAGGVAEGFTKVQHQKRMLSLNDVFTDQELIEWEERWQKYADQNSIKFDLEQKVNYICEPKIDGLAISLVYENGKLEQAVTRGDGFVGEDVTNNVLQIQSIPKSISDQRKLEVRGEVFMTKTDFEELNQKIIDGILPGKMSKTGPEYVFANPRNVASGTIRQLDSSVVKGRKLSFIAYNVYILEEVLI